MTRPAPTFYVFHGDDDLSIDEAVGKLRAGMGSGPNADLNISEFDGQTTDIGEIIGAACSYPFLSDKRLVIVRGLIGWLTRKGAGEAGRKALDTLVEALPDLPDYAKLVLVERAKLPENNRIVALAQQDPRGYERRFTVPRDSASWLVKRAREEYGTEIEPRAAAALASVTGDDLRGADNELLKLVSFVDGQRPITEDDVARLTPYVAEASLFDMVDALAEGRAEAAVSLVHKLLDNQKEDPFGLYGMIVRQFRLLLLTREYLSSGGSPANIASELHVHSFVAQKLAKQSRSFTLAQLEHIYRALLDNDLKMKTGRIKPELAIDLFIASLTQER